MTLSRKHLLCCASLLLFSVTIACKSNTADDNGDARGGSGSGSGGGSGGGGGGPGFAGGGPASPPPSGPDPNQQGSLQSGEGIPILINDTANTSSVVHDPALTSFLVPLARSEGLTSIAQLAMYDENGQRLPAQFEVLSRWGSAPFDTNAPIRFAYAHVLGTPQAGTGTTWRVANNAPSPSTTQLGIDTQPQTWVITTGPARFTIRRGRFEGISQIEVADGTGGFQIISGSVGAQVPGGFFMEHGGSTKSTAYLTPWKFELERSGPVMVTIVARGYYAANAGDTRDMNYNGAAGWRHPAYTVRMHFVAGSSVVKIDHTSYHGITESFGAGGATNTTTFNRIWMRLPLSGTATSLAVRANGAVLSPSAGSDVLIEQRKRFVNTPDLRYRIRAGGSDLETGTRARNPFLAAVTGNGYFMATIARLHERDPQGLRWNAGARAIDIDFISEPLQVGGARGIFSTAVIDVGTALSDAASRGTQLQLAAERPLIGTPAPAYLNGTETIGPYPTVSSTEAFADGYTYRNYFNVIQQYQATTKQYLEDCRVTGVQVWPDLSRSTTPGPCGTSYFDGGENNYWNWSKPGIDFFFWTGNNDYFYDFSDGEAKHFAETAAYRVDHDRSVDGLLNNGIFDNNMIGMAPCYGDSFGWANNAIEGVNQRRDRCFGDYTYNKHLKLAYLATGDRRYVDFFEEAGAVSLYTYDSAVRSANERDYREPDFSRLGEQRFENIANGAEFATDPQLSTALLSGLRRYVDGGQVPFGGPQYTGILNTSLFDGHVCILNASSQLDARQIGTCDARQGWMLPTVIDWMIRVQRFLNDPDLAQWIRRSIVQNYNQYTVTSNDIPDFSRWDASPGGWCTVYACSTNEQGVNDASCQKDTTAENNCVPYLNGLMAFLNVFGQLLDFDTSDPSRICEWLPTPWIQSATNMSTDILRNDLVWGKGPGQAFGFSAEAVAALINCP